MFDCIRNFVRYDIGNPKVFYVFNNIILAPANKEHPEVPMNTKLIEDMMFSGLYPFWCIGHLFYLEIFPMAFNVNGLSYFYKQAKEILLPVVGNEGIFEFKDIMQIDFLMQRFNSQKTNP